MLLRSLSLLLVGFTSCAAAQAAYYVPPERATECRVHCSDLDMRLSAVVVIANMAGCVCQPKDEGVRTGTAAEAGSAAVAGGAAIALAVARSRQSQETTEQLMITAAPTF